MRTVFLILVALVSDAAFAQQASTAQDEAAQIARFKSESMLCAAFYARAAFTAEPGSELAQKSERNAQLYLEAARAAGATDEFIQGVIAAYTLLASRGLVTPEAQLKLLDRCETLFDE